jgi:hypothetical protein
MKRCEYPVGNPKIITRETLVDTLPWCKPADNKFKGLLLVNVLPPRNLLYPLLPYRTSNSQLAFPLCKTCAEVQNNGECQHSDDERSWIACYTHAELNKALSLGYTVVDVFEVWHYTKWKSGADGLFTGYMDTFIKLKVGHQLFFIFFTFLHHKGGGKRLACGC